MEPSHKITWYAGLALVDHTYSAFVQAEQKYREENMKLRDAIKAGVYTSAWGDEDTPDSVGLSQRDGTVTTMATLQAALKAQEVNRLKELAKTLRAEERARAEAKAQQEAIIAAAAAAERDRVAHEQLEEIEGFGSF